jgi:hypothetical protein
VTLPIIKWDGKPITRPGIYDGVPIETYHDDPDLFGGEPHISSGGLRAVEDPESSLLHFYEGWVMNPEREKPEPAAHFSLGQAAHMLFLGEEGFRKKFVVRPTHYTDEKGEEKPWHHAAKPCKAWAEYQAKAGMTVLKDEELEVIKKMAVRLGAHPDIQAGMLNGLIEKSIFWPRIVTLEDGRTVRIWLKARPDVLPTDSAMVVDYKTCADAGPLAVRRSITDFGYHQQLALIQEGLWVVARMKTETHVLVFQEKKSPHAVNVKVLFDSAMAVGHIQNHRALHKVARAIITGEWPGYEDDGTKCDLMEWRIKQLQQEIKDGRLPEDVKMPDPIDLTPLPAPKAAPAMPEFEDL